MSLHDAVLEQYAVALDRKRSGGAEKSYTTYLLNAGEDKILKKCGEETFEAVIAAKGTDAAETLGELNDVLYHVTVLLVLKEVGFEPVLAALNRRCGTEGEKLDRLYDIIVSRRTSEEEGSYTRYLFEQGLDKILKKVGEACALLLIASKNNDAAALAEETADLLYHLFAMMAAVELTPADLEAELDHRSQKTGNLKTFHTTDVNT